MVSSIIVEEADHCTEAHEAAPTSDFQCKFEHGRNGNAWIEQGIQARADQHYVDVCWKKVGFEESMKEVEHVGPIDRL